MKHLFVMLLLGSIAQQGFAQNNYPFDIPANSTNRLFWVELGNGNKMEVHVNNIDDLDKLQNMDSLIYGFLKDLNNFRDSLQNELAVKRVDYNVDDADNRKLRITQYPQSAVSYLVKDGEVAAMKTVQDTVNFIGKTNFVADYPLRKKFDDVRYYKVVFLVNNISDLNGYMNGLLNRKIISMKENANKKWDNNLDKSYSPRADSTIRGRIYKGYVAGGDFLTLRASVDIQNYKSTFVPSVSYGVAFIFGGKNIKREIGIGIENHFSFAKGTSGNLRTYISHFVSLSYARGYIKDGDINKNSAFLLNVNAAYMFKQKGSLYEKNTLRLGAGALSLFEGKTTIQPQLYVNGFFKSVTPGLRWVQSF
ncbi:MAG: hypothetical protein QM687_08985 [Ferruginibacter sp.]